MTHSTSPPSRAAKRGTYTVVAKVRGAWKAIATRAERLEAIPLHLATPGSYLYGPDRKAVSIAKDELRNPHVDERATKADAAAPVERIPAPKRPRLSDSLHVRLTPEDRQWIEEAAQDGARWPGGYTVENADVVREAIRRMRESPR